MHTTPRWDSLRAVWPNAAASQFVNAAGLRWHVQILGAGPVVVLLHGSGAASHSWGDVAALLAANHTVVVPDLPGHGFTTGAPPERLSLECMASDTAALLESLELVPVAIAGHSAGGALALRMASFTSSATPRCVIGVNAALTPPTEALPVLAPLIQSVARTSFVGTLTALFAESDSMFRSLMRSTGSTVTPAQFELYRTFARSPMHTRALMTMFTAWNMSALQTALPLLATDVTLVTGTRDSWVPPEQSRLIAASMRNARVIAIDNAGHLAHEEFPGRVADIIAEAARRASVTGDSGQGAARAQ